MWAGDRQRDLGALGLRLAAAFEVRGQELTVTDGNARFVQVGMPVYSERYGRLIDFDTDGEEWARNLASAYRNGAVSVHAEEGLEQAEPASKRHTRAPALAFGRARRRN